MQYRVQFLDRSDNVIREELQLGNPTMGAAVATVMFFIILVGVCLYLFIVQRRLRRYAF